MDQLDSDIPILLLVTMTVHGSLVPFDKEESQACYTKHLDFYFNAHNIGDVNKKCAVLLSACGASTETLRNLIHFAKSMDKSYQDLVDTMEKHLNPPSSELYELFMVVQ